MCHVLSSFASPTLERQQAPLCSHLSLLRNRSCLCKAAFWASNSAIRFASSETTSSRKRGSVSSALNLPCENRMPSPRPETRNPVPSPGPRTLQHLRTTLQNPHKNRKHEPFPVTQNTTPYCPPTCEASNASRSASRSAAPEITLSKQTVCLHLHICLSTSFGVNPVDHAHDPLPITFKNALYVCMCLL